LFGTFATPEFSNSYASAASPCVDSWQPAPFSPSLIGLDAEGVTTLAGQPAWIVGLSSAQSESKRVPVIGRWTGTEWDRVPAPWKAYGVLNAVAATSASNAMAVGSIGSYTRWPIAARWDGTQWTAVSVPRPTGQLGVLTDISMVDATRYWVVGDRLQSGLLKPLVMYHNANGWKRINPSIPANAEGGLSDVTIAPGGVVWAAGWRTDALGQVRPWIMHRHDGAWVTTNIPALDAGKASVMDLAFASATDGWAAGFIEKDGSGYEPLLLHWNGSSWTSVSTAWASGQSMGLSAVQVEPSGRVVLAGWQVDQLLKDVVAVLDGSKWTVTSMSAGTRGRGAMTDTAPLANGTLVAGYSDGFPASLLPCATAPARTTQSSVTTGLPSASRDDGSTTAAQDSDEDPSALSPDPSDNLALLTQSVTNTVAVDRTAAAGLTLNAPTWGGVVADFNNDTRPDVYINRHFQDYPVMMLNSSTGAFSSLAGNWGLRDRHRCDAADVDADGQLDLFCTIGVNKATSNIPQELTLDPGNAGGTWATRAFGVLDGFGRGRDATFLNLDGDQFPDLFVVNESSRSDAMSSSNRLYRNVGGTHFVSASSWGLDHSMAGSCVTNADIDADGDDDLLLCTGEPVGGVPAGVRVFINTGSAFVDRTDSLGLGQSGAAAISVADFNGDGALDVAELSRKLLTVKLRSGASFTKSYSLTMSAAVAMAVGDVNGDGRPDIYVSRRTAGNQGHLMLVNDGNGTGFTSMAIPQPGAGRADDVLAIDYDGNGRTDFVTLNGWFGAGPVTLTAFYPNP